MKCSMLSIILFCFCFRSVSFSFISVRYIFEIQTHKSRVDERLWHWPRIKAWAVLIKSLRERESLLFRPLLYPPPPYTYSTHFGIYRKPIWKILAFKNSRNAVSQRNNLYCAGLSLALFMVCERERERESERENISLFVYTDCCCRKFDPQKTHITLSWVTIEL